LTSDFVLTGVYQEFDRLYDVPGPRETRFWIAHTFEQLAQILST
jgi:hypothetical protein